MVYLCSMVHSAEHGFSPETERKVLVVDSGSALIGKEVMSRCEDTVVDDQEHGLFAVADGMGGMPHGDVASRLACTTLDSTFARSKKRGMAEKLQESVDVCANAMHAQKTDPKFAGMGTTLTAVAAEASTDGTVELAIAHVGDSRGYLIRQDSGVLERLTTDDGFVELLVSSGILPEAIGRAIDQSTKRGEDVPEHPVLKDRATLESAINAAIVPWNRFSRDLTSLKRCLRETENRLSSRHNRTATQLLYHMSSYLLNSMDTGATTSPTVRSVKARTGDTLVICSDGITDVLTEKEIETIVRESLLKKMSAREIARQIAEAAEASSGNRKKRDDRAVVVVILGQET